MRVLEIIQGFGRGGAEVSLVNRIRLKPSDVETLILNLRPALDNLSYTHDVKVINIMNGEFRKYFAIRKLMLDFNPDIVIIRTPRDLIYFVTLFSFLNRKSFLVFEVTSEISSEKFAKKYILNRLIPAFNKKVDLHIAVSQRVSQSRMCLNARKKVVHYTGGSVDLMASSALKEIEGVHFVHIGRLISLKRPLWALQRILAIGSEFRNSKSQITFVGDGPELIQMLNFIEVNRMEDIAFCIGQTDNVSKYLVKADVLVITSLSEGLPQTVYEAKLHGVRILTTPAGGTSEILGPRDLVSETFQEEEFERLLLTQLTLGKQNIENRKNAMRENSVFDSENCVSNFYDILKVNSNSSA